MNFIQAFDKVNKPAAAPAPAQFMQANISQDNKSFMNDDMKSYIDAKFEALKSDLLAAQTVNKGTNKTVETPQESADNPNNNINEGGNDNASSTDL